MATLNEIDVKTKAFADARGQLAQAVADMQDELQVIQRKYLPMIKRRVAAAKDVQAALRAAIEASPEQFVKPRTLTLYGVKVGFQKGKGKMEWEDDDRVVLLIKRHFPKQADLLISTVEKPSKAALGELAVDDLKKLGITVEGTGDVVVIKDASGEVDKLVKALLKEEEEIEA